MGQGRADVGVMTSGQLSVVREQSARNRRQEKRRPMSKLKWKGQAADSTAAMKMLE